MNVLFPFIGIKQKDFYLNGVDNTLINDKNNENESKKLLKTIKII